MNDRPTEKEINFLHSAYNFFFEIDEEIKNGIFWEKDPYYRFNRIKDAFLVYSEILEYEPIGWFLETLKKVRPPMEAELSKEFILFIRNLLIHFPFFKSWEDVKFTKGLINWSKPGKSIDKFVSQYTGHDEVKYRMWNPKNKTMMYVSIKFPIEYSNKSEIGLRDFIPEREGIIFTMSLMYQVLASQIESMKNIS